jgi:anti-sigma regulatory factor (Ser/Thr protein kinase)
MANLEFQLEPGPDAPHDARRLIRRRMADVLPAPQLYDLLMVISELITNSVGHGPGMTIGVRLEVAGDGSLRGEVEDGGTPDIELSEISASLDSGLGLRIIDAIATRWGVDDDGSTVFFELPAG